jgi:hypothetical protein
MFIVFPPDILGAVMRYKGIGVGFAWIKQKKLTINK